MDRETLKKILETAMDIDDSMETYRKLSDESFDPDEHESSPPWPGDHGGDIYCIGHTDEETTYGETTDDLDCVDFLSGDAELECSTAEIRTLRRILDAIWERVPDSYQQTSTWKIE